MNKTVKQHGYKSVFFDLIITCAFLFVFAELIISIYGRTHDVSETSFFFHTNAGWIGLGCATVAISLFLIVAMIYKFHNGNANCKAFAITTIILLSIAIIGEICYIIYNGIWLTHSTVGDYMSKWFDVDLL